MSVIYRQPPSSAHSPASSSPPSLSVGSREKEKLLGSFTILRNKFRNISQKTRGRLEGVVSPRSGPSLRTYIDTAPESEGVSGEGGDDGEEEERGGGKTDPGAGPLSIGVPRYSAGRSDSIGRGVRPGYRVGLRRSGSDDTMSSQSTLVPPSSFLLQSEDHPLGIADLIHTSQPTLTLSRIQAHDKYRSHSYRGFRGEGGKREKEMEERESREDDDQRTIEGEWVCQYHMLSRIQTVRTLQDTHSFLLYYIPQHSHKWYVYTSTQCLDAFTSGMYVPVCRVSRYQYCVRDGSGESVLSSLFKQPQKL